MPSLGLASLSKPKPSWNGMEPCASAALAPWALSIVPAPPKSKRKKSRKRNPPKKKSSMPREIVTLECTEARKEGKPPSRYLTTRNKKLKTEKIELRKYNPFLRRHTLHREIK